MENTYKYPRLRMQMSEIFVRLLIWRGIIIGIGKEAKTKSVNRFMAKWR